jgi:hypothetical protein
MEIPILDQPITPVYAFTRMFPSPFMHFSICWHAKEKYIPILFYVGTGLPLPFYFSEKAYKILRDHDVIKTDTDYTDYVLVHLENDEVRKFSCARSEHEDANNIGLGFLRAAGLRIDGDSWSFLRVGDVF